MAKHQHYVPRKYLRAWASKEKIWCLRDNKIFHPNVMGVAQERYFYRLGRLDENDFRLAHAIAIEPIKNQELRRACEGLLDSYRHMFALEKLIPTGHSNQKFDEFLNTIDDEVITGLEHQVFPYLDQAIAGDLSFLKDQSSAIAFYHGLMLQYFRTHKIRANLLAGMTVNDSNRIARIWPLFRTLYSVITSFHIASKELPFTATVLSSPADSYFITSDQPIINIDAVYLNYEEIPQTVQFYYPLSPVRALLLSENPSSDYHAQPLLSQNQLTRLNQYMMMSSHRQVYAESHATLAALTGMNGKF